MISLRSEETLAEIVERNPRAASVFESTRLDYCCGGRRTLETACRDAGVDPGDVREKLARTKPFPASNDWSSLNPADLADHIETTHHSYLLDELPRLEARAGQVASLHGVWFPRVVTVQELVTSLRADLEPHLAKEQLVLFPMIRQLVAQGVSQRFHCGTVANPIHIMQGEHDGTALLLREIEVVTDRFRPPALACESFRALYRDLAELVADTHLHTHKENNVLFPAVLALEENTAIRDGTA
jgi:regulator of cell morphogenesis and NO signaling